MGCDYVFTAKNKAGAEFQSTHPVWGATADTGNVIHLLTISIHAPRVGCDADTGKQGHRQRRISIHAPRVGCDVILLGKMWYEYISIHAPRVGCDPDVETVNFWQSIISIHAPRVGCDVAQHGHQMPPNNFNPRTPCGVRQRQLSARQRYTEFQSTHPVWGATTCQLYCF